MLSRLFYGSDKYQKQAAVVKLSIDSARYNFGISGYTKTGKSTLVNTLMGMDMAAIGSTETTERISKYDISTIPDSTLWDLPGCGTFKFSEEKYFQEQTLYAFDTLIIVTQDDITPIEMNFAAESLKRDQSVIFVRSKSDMTLDNHKKLEKITNVDQDAADEFVKQKLIKFEKQIKEAKIGNIHTVKVFIISSFVLWQSINGITPKYWFQEKEFLRELNQAAECKRGK